MELVNVWGESCEDYVFMSEITSTSKLLVLSSHLASITRFKEKNNQLINR